MSRYNRENPDQPSRHNWFEGAITGKTPESSANLTPLVGIVTLMPLFYGLWLAVLWICGADIELN